MSKTSLFISFSFPFAWKFCLYREDRDCEYASPFRTDVDSNFKWADGGTLSCMGVGFAYKYCAAVDATALVSISLVDAGQ